MTVPKKLRYWVIGGVTALGALGGVVWLRPYYQVATGPVPEDRCPGHERFWPREWRDTLLAYSELALRGCMVTDLLNKIKLVGMDREAVVRLLGEPTPTAHFDKGDLVYWLGPETGLFSIDSEWLVIKLDTTGRVIEAKVMTD